MRRKISTIIIVLFLIVGIGLLAYPTVSNKWNEMHSSRAISTYDETIAALTPVDYSRLLERAQLYNQKIPIGSTARILSDDQRNEYNGNLNPIGTGMMGILRIEKIDCKLPIYHGTQQDVLQTSIGHLEWSSLPVGGNSSHCVVSGHRGLPSAKLLTRLDEMVVGDTFKLEVLNDIYTYQVDQILTVLPDDVDDLKVVEGKDYCTLITCTPYGVNTHRLLVRGTRIYPDGMETSVLEVHDDNFQQVLMICIAVGAALFALIIILVIVFLRRRW